MHEFRIPAKDFESPVMFLFVLNDREVAGKIVASRRRDDLPTVIHLLTDVKEPKLLMGSRIYAGVQVCDPIRFDLPTRSIDPLFYFEIELRQDLELYSVDLEELGLTIRKP